MAAKAKASARAKPAKTKMDAFSATGTAASYEAAGTGRRATTWRAAAAGPNASLTYALPTLVRRSRDAVRKNPYADRAVSVIETNAVGTGIKPQFRTPDAGLNKELAALWLDWTDESDADGVLDFYGQQCLIARALVEAGEVFGRFRIRRPSDMATVPLQLQILESEMCPVSEVRALSGRDVRNGVEFDLVGKRTAYWMYRQHPNDQFVTNLMFDAMPYPVPASEIMHVYEPRRPGAIRGEPWLTRALIKLRDLDGYDDATLMRAKVATLIAGFIHSPDGETDFEGEQEADEDGNADVVWEPGTIAKLGPGEEINFSTPQEASSTYETFMRQQLRAVAVATRTLYEQLTGDYSKVNDRTFRASVNEFRRSVETLQHNILVFQFCRPVVNRWLDLAMLAGEITVPRGFGPRDLYRVDWLPPRWPYIHPVQDIQADTQEIQAGLSSRSKKVSERGYDAEELDEENAADAARADNLGLTYTSDGRHATGAGDVEEPEEDKAESGDGESDGDGTQAEPGEEPGDEAGQESKDA